MNLILQDLKESRNLTDKQKARDLDGWQLDLRAIYHTSFFLNLFFFLLFHLQVEGDSDSYCGFLEGLKRKDLVMFHILYIKNLL